MPKMKDHPSKRQGPQILRTCRRRQTKLGQGRSAAKQVGVAGEVSARHSRKVWKIHLNKVVQFGHGFLVSVEGRSPACSSQSIYFQAR